LLRSLAVAVLVAAGLTLWRGRPGRH
jgi:hypothetical protein